MTTLRRIAGVLVLGSLFAGCASLQIEGIGNEEVVALDGMDIVRLMRQAGYSDEQILEHGTELRNALAIQGAAEVRIEGMVSALYAVSGNRIHITTRDRGSFVYDIEAGTCR